VKIAYFGGTFDPVHNGHLTVARAALERMQLDRILFVPAGNPPHKPTRRLTPYIHRYAMLTLALAEAGEKKFLPSLLESPEDGRRAHYSVETLTRLLRETRKADRVYYLLGMDAFRSIAGWRQPEKLLRACEFIVVSRPGYSMQDVADALPASLRPRTIIRRTASRNQPVETLRFPGVTIHLLQGVRSPVSATAVRTGLRKKSSPHRGFTGPVPRLVAEYIQKVHLYEVE
jgi:nicotinate-nucleotide adenylyltransferase